MVVSALSVLFAVLLGQKSIKQAYAFAGAEAAIAWRAQVFDLWDRGMTVEQIRDVFRQEDGWEGYERENGKLDDILRRVPRRSAPQE